MSVSGACGLTGLCHGSFVAVGGQHCGCTKLPVFAGAISALEPCDLPCRSGENVFLCIGHVSYLVQTSITPINVYKRFRGTIIYVFVSIFPHSHPLAKIEK